MKCILNILVVLTVLMLVNANDFRLYFIPKNGESVDELCEQWDSECKNIANKNQFKGNLYYVCEPNYPKVGEIAAYCISLYKGNYTQYTDVVSKSLGATHL